MSTKKKQPTTKSRSEPVHIEQPPLPGLDTDEFRSFVDLSEGVAVKNCCPKCGYRW